MSTDTAAPVLLYVEDEILIRIGLSAVLEDAGFCVMTAGDGDDALAFLASHGRSLHGLMTDVNLRRGPDGWDVAEAARKLVIDLPVVYVSAASQGDWTTRGVCNSLMVTKPFLPDDAVAAISSLMIAS